MYAAIKGRIDNLGQLVEVAELKELKRYCWMLGVKRRSGVQLWLSEAGKRHLDGMDMKAIGMTASTSASSTGLQVAIAAPHLDHSEKDSDDGKEPMAKTSKMGRPIQPNRLLSSSL